RFLGAAGISEEVPIESKMVSNAIRSAQTQVESLNFEMRKNVLKYDDVMNRQRTVVYSERREVLEGADISEQVQNFMTDTVTAYVQGATTEGYPEQWNLETLFSALNTLYPASISPESLASEVGGIANLDADLILNRVLDDAKAQYSVREESLTEPVMRELERKVLLSVLDRKWREHLYEMDYLQEGIGLRAMAQRDPLVEYQREGYELFAAMMDGIKEELVGLLFHVDVNVETTDEDGSPVIDAPGLEAPEPTDVNQLRYTAADEDGAAVQSGGISRNAPCPCGSGKKYKRCHGAT
ncbi:MAG TPA: SEC-C metal-binding domain-containing protein, partial [Candidatus Nanopelagicaceae bacterium]